MYFKTSGVKTKLSCVRLLSTKAIYPPLERVQEISSGENIKWLDIYHLQRPILFKGIIREWPACQKWKDFDYLKNKVNSSSSNEKVIVPVECGESYMDSRLQILNLDFVELLDFFQKDIPDIPKLYLAQFDLNEIPGLMEDLDVPEITKTGSSIYRTNIWLGGQSGSSSPCHNDPFDNILCQIIGNKKVILFPPSSKQYLYLNDPHHKQKNTSRIDFRKPDHVNFPLFKDTPNGLYAYIESGDALFIPLRWYHYCETTALSCSVNYWWL